MISGTIKARTCLLSSVWSAAAIYAAAAAKLLILLHLPTDVLILFLHNQVGVLGFSRPSKRCIEMKIIILYNGRTWGLIGKLHFLKVNKPERGL